MITEQYQQTQLPNGVQIVTERVPHALSVSLGIWVRTGPRYEGLDQQGISHFVEHMLFKGTHRRSAKEINEALYPAGGHLNAFTDREFTCYTAYLLPEHLELAVDVLCDMITASVFDPEELDRERRVILEEIRAIEDTPEDLVHDLFAEKLWPDHPLGRPIIGRVETVSTFDRDSITGYVAQRYAADSLLVSAAGNLQHGALVEMVVERLGSLKGSHDRIEFNPPSPRAGSVIVYRKTEQAHFCLGLTALPQRDDDNYPLIILDTVFGSGPHSRLFDEIREKRGLVYSVGSGLSAYAESGVFSVSASTSPENLIEVVRIVREQIDRIAEEGLTTDEIDRARQHLGGTWLLSHESMGARMGRMAHAQLYFDRMIPFREVLEKLAAVTTEDILRAARRVLRNDASAIAVIGPIRSRSRDAAALRAA